MNSPRYDKYGRRKMSREEWGILACAIRDAVFMACFGWCMLVVVVGLFAK